MDANLKSQRLLPFSLTFVVFILLSSKDSSAQAQLTNKESFLVQALSWMTYRENGVVLTEAQLKQKWMDTSFKEKLKNKLYPLFVTAFQHGVLPRMTLNEKDPCDPSYRMEYKYWYNDTTTEYSLIRFAMKSYVRQYYPEMGPKSSAYCDYRQGLICSRTSKKCECPPGSTMSPVTGSPLPPNQRCLVKENEICVSLDAAANGGKNDQLKGALPYLILDPERPLGCVEGTQCRFKAGNLVTPLCYSSSDPKWEEGAAAIPFGEECTLNLYSQHGMCHSSDSRDKLICYNYGLAPSTISAGTAPNKTGICTGNIGVFGGPGINYWFLNFDLYPKFMRGLLTPRFIPLRGQKLLEFHEKMYLFENSYEQNYAVGKGSNCSVDRTDRVIALFRFFRSLQGPVFGTGPVITPDEAKLNAAVDEGQDLVREKISGGTPTVGICNINGEGYSCVATGKRPDKQGNDGTCSKSFTESKLLWDHYYKPYQELYTKVGKFWEHLHKEWAQFLEQFDSRISVRHDGNKAGHCDPKIAGAGSPCTGEEFCSFDYTDFTEDGEPIYQDNNCNFVAGHQPIYKCKDISQQGMWSFGACEQKILEEKMEEILEEIFRRGGGKYPTLGNGEPCNYNMELTLKEMFVHLRKGDLSLMNGYRFLKYVTTSSADAGLCDSARLLECKKEGKCGCVERTKPRMSADKLYSSDYCYFADEKWCDRDVAEFVPYLEYEKKDLYWHYGDPKRIGRIGSPCAYSNVCMFLHEWNFCTDKNSGKTGGEEEPPVWVDEPTTTEGEGMVVDQTEAPHVVVPVGPAATLGTLAPPMKYAGAGRPTMAIINVGIIMVMSARFTLEYLYYN